MGINESLWVTICAGHNIRGQANRVYGQFRENLLYEGTGLYFVTLSDTSHLLDYVFQNPNSVQQSLIWRLIWMKGRVKMKNCPVRRYHTFRITFGHSLSRFKWRIGIGNLLFSVNNLRKNLFLLDFGVTNIASNIVMHTQPPLYGSPNVYRPTERHTNNGESRPGLSYHVL